MERAGSTTLHMLVGLYLVVEREYATLKFGLLRVTIPSTVVPGTSMVVARRFSWDFLMVWSKQIQSVWNQLHPSCQYQYDQRKANARYQCQIFVANNIIVINIMFVVTAWLLLTSLFFLCRQRGYECALYLIFYEGVFCAGNLWAAWTNSWNYQIRTFSNKIILSCFGNDGSSSAMQLVGHVGASYLLGRVSKNQ